jgi:hypothetical protein
MLVQMNVGCVRGSAYSSTQRAVKAKKLSQISSNLEAQ